MLSIDSSRWRLRVFNEGGAVHLVQRASGAIRTVNRSTMPDDAKLAAMHERTFNSLCRAAFHGEARK